MSETSTPPQAEQAPKPKKKGGVLRGIKRLFAFLSVLTVLAGGYLAAAHFSGGAYYTFGLPIGGDAGFLRRTTLSFWEDIQFKDFERAATYHHPDDQDTVDIPYLIQRLFAVKPEALDIMDYEVVMVDEDSTGRRARVKSRITVKSLLNEKVDEKEIMLFFQREDDDSPWYMELEDSLRSLEADKDKKH